VLLIYVVLAAQYELDAAAGVILIVPMTMFSSPASG
jgi:hypothetical protein